MTPTDRENLAPWQIAALMDDEEHDALLTYDAACAAPTDGTPKAQIDKHWAVEAAWDNYKRLCNRERPRSGRPAPIDRHAAKVSHDERGMRIL